MFNKRIVFWSACFGMLLFGVALITLGSIATDLKDKLEMSEIETGTLFSILPLGILIGSLVFGPVADRYGYKLLLTITCIFLAAGFEGVAFSASSVLLKSSIFLIGLSGGVLNGATNALVSDISDSDRTANISLLGVFFGIGALGIPLLLSSAGEKAGFEKIVSLVGLISLIGAIIYALTKFPPPKIVQNIPISGIKDFFRDKVLLLIAFFLFFQSSFEGLMNNWTTSYLADHLSLSQGKALLGLSLFVGGMVSMRLVTGILIRNMAPARLLAISFILLITGIAMVQSGKASIIAPAGFFLMGTGLANGFPVMLGLAGERYKLISGTAFSFVLAIALLGNMIINYLMGIISQKAGIGYLVFVISIETLIMILLGIMIFKNYKKKRL
ncbi:MAG TPA: MFS transporter [Bacteroidales bacterium]|nr:MFS transporter [Bacteroidales bacterium]